MRLSHVAGLCAALALSGCALFPKPQTPTQGVYEIGDAYVAALKVAVAYEHLPPCDRSHPVCSDPNVLARVQVADKAAFSAWTTAENLAMQGKADATVLSDASVTVQAFVALTSSLRVH